MGLCDVMCQAVPVVMATSTAPPFFIVWCGFRLISLPLPSTLVYKLDDMMWSSYQRLLLFFYEHLTSTKLYIHGDVECIKNGVDENVLYISNHQTTMDWVVADMLALRQGQLGRLRFILKHDLKYIPLYGYHFLQHGCIYVKRSKGHFKKEVMVDCLQNLLYRDCVGWLIVFPEGTRLRPKRNEVPLVGSEESSCFHHVLPPRWRGMACCLEVLGRHLDAVYDVTLIYGETGGFEERVSGEVEGAVTRRERKPVKGMFEWLTKRNRIIHAHIRRYPLPVELRNLSDSDNKEEMVRLWLDNIFTEKDKLLSTYYDNHPPSLPHPLSSPHLLPVPLSSTLPHLLLWTATTLPFIFYPRARVWYLSSLLIGSVWGYSYMAVMRVD